MSARDDLIIKEDDGFLIVAKPSGMETIAIGTHSADERYCLTSRCRAVTGNKALAPAHRLDRDTTGVQIFAKTAADLAHLETLFRQRRVEKKYLALCLGIPANAEGVIRRNLSEWSSGRRPVRAIKGKGGLRAESSYRLLAKGSLTASQFNGRLPANAWRACEVSLLLWQPREGRTHQIRVHAAAFGHPILGDDQYGDRGANRLVKYLCGLRRHALHCWRMCFPHPRTGAMVTAEAPLPADLVAALAAAGIPCEALMNATFSLQPRAANAADYKPARCVAVGSKNRKPRRARKYYAPD